MPKVRYPVLVREQKAAVMRVRHVIYTSELYPMYAISTGATAGDARILGFSTEVILKTYNEDGERDTVGTSATFTFNTLRQVLKSFSQEYDDSSASAAATFVFNTLRVVLIEFTKEYDNSQPSASAAATFTFNTLRVALVEVTQDADADASASATFIGMTLT